MNQKVLIVDDDPLIIDIIRLAIKQEGYDIFSATSGEEAYEQSIEHKPDIILLDLNMSGLNGYEVCKIFKASKELLDIPIIFVTANANNIEEAFDAGAADYINKPIKPAELKARLAFHLHKQHMIEEIRLLNLEAKKRIEKLSADLAFSNKKLVEAIDELRELKETN